ncbi:MAG TPA: hypothetical protein VMN35_07870 [Gaiellaceae bacterium]|nr:hypothetical protein [Gaiellaceae bacterium]
MSLDDWILALHVLSAFALVGAMVLFWVLVVATRGPDEPEATRRLAPVSRVANAAVISGAIGALVFGIWLALSVGGYELWDGWIVAALVLWVLGVGTGQRSGAAFERGDQQRGLLFHTVSSVAILLILVDMIWKPGA